MEKNIKDFLPHYINHVNYRVRYVDNPPGEWTMWSKLTPGRYARAVEDFSVAQIEIELRKLESITDDEIIEGGWSGRRQFIYYTENNKGAYYPSDFHYLLSKGFDLFGLIESGLAIEKQPTTQNQRV